MRAPLLVHTWALVRFWPGGNLPKTHTPSGASATVTVWPCNLPAPLLLLLVSAPASSTREAFCPHHFPCAPPLAPKNCQDETKAPNLRDNATPPRK